jgi:hypothetical protein
MKQAVEYRKNAAECRRLARTARDGPERDQLMDMVETWERITADRERWIALNPLSDVADNKADQAA